MSTNVTKPGSSGLAPLVAAPGFVLGLVVTDVRPGIGLVLGVAFAVLAVALFLWRRAPRWLAWLAAGVVAGVAALFLLAVLQLVNPNATPASGEGSGSAGPR